MSQIQIAFQRLITGCYNTPVTHHRPLPKMRCCAGTQRARLSSDCLQIELTLSPYKYQDHLRPPNISYETIQVKSQHHSSPKLPIHHPTKTPNHHPPSPYPTDPSLAPPLPFPTTSSTHNTPPSQPRPSQPPTPNTTLSPSRSLRPNTPNITTYQQQRRK